MILEPGSYEHDIVLHEKLRCRAIQANGKRCQRLSNYVIYPHDEPAAEFGLCGQHFGTHRRGISHLEIEWH